MQFLANFIMLGRWQAAMIATVTAILALILPAVVILSAGTIALVTLRIGTTEGIIVAAISTIASAILTQLLLNNGLLALGILIMLWIPIVILGTILRETRSLAFTTQIGLSIGIAGILLLYILTYDSQILWTQILEILTHELMQSEVLAPKNQQELIHALIPWMTSVLAAIHYLFMILSLFLARSWQAHLYNPGGFAEEFRTLRMNPLLAVASILLMVLTGYQSTETASFIRDLVVLPMPLLFIQGLAVAHGIELPPNIRIIWLVGIYILLLLVSAPMILLLIIIGLTDVWIDFRKWLPSIINPKL